MLTACENPRNTLILSVASAWEIEIKSQLGRLNLDMPLEDLIDRLWIQAPGKRIPGQAHHRGCHMATAETTKTLNHVYKLIPLFINLPPKKMWLDYDKDADVFYINFKKPQRATDSEMLENGVLLRYRGTELVGITITGSIKEMNLMNTKG